MTKVDLQAKVDNLQQEIEFLTTLFQAVSPLISTKAIQLKREPLSQNPPVSKRIEMHLPSPEPPSVEEVFLF